MIHGSENFLRDIGVGLLRDPTMMGTFAFPQPIHIGNVSLIATCNMISSTKIAGRRIIIDRAMVLPPSPVGIL